MIVLNITIASHGLRPRPRFTRLVRTPPHRLKTRVASLPTEPPRRSSKRARSLASRPRIPVPKIEKPHLTHQPRLPLSTNRQPDSKSTTPEKGEFLEVPSSWGPDRLSSVSPVSSDTRSRRHNTGATSRGRAGLPPSRYPGHPGLPASRSGRAQSDQGLSARFCWMARTCNAWSRQLGTRYSRSAEEGFDGGEADIAGADTVFAISLQRFQEGQQVAHREVLDLQGTGRILVCSAA